MGTALTTWLKSVMHAIRTYASQFVRKVDKLVEARLEEMRKRWEEGDYQPENPLHRLRGQAYIWLFSMRRRWRTHVPLRSWLLPIGASFASLILAMFLHSAAVQLQFAAVIISMRAGGLRSGLLSTFICCSVMTLIVRGSLHGPTAPVVVLALVSFLIVAVLACVLIDSLESARQEAEAQRDSAGTDARRFRFLAEATAMLESEYTYEGVLQAVTRAIVPACAQWAVADVYREGQLHRAALSHQNDAFAALLGAAQRNRPIPLPVGHPLYEALLSRNARILPNVTEADLAPLSLDHQDAKGLKPAHLLFVPLCARHRLLGALTLISTRADQPFTGADLYAARDLGLRVGTALDNLRHYYSALDEAAEIARREKAVSSQKTQLEAVNARLEIEATTDGLTGLLNHLTFKRSLDEEFIRARSTGAPLSVALLDVDRFKLYNDSFGHPAGDAVLQRMASIMQATTRSTDFVARYGGEEFVVVMPNTDCQGALDTMERLRRAIETSSWPKRQVTASLGISTLSADTVAPRDLIAAADEALYRSKQAGRNRIHHADIAQEAVVFNRVSLTSEEFAA
jgi:diguanylate cyclase (GGDEF)-like protein